MNTTPTTSYSSGIKKERKARSFTVRGPMWARWHASPRTRPASPGRRTVCVCVSCGKDELRVCSTCFTLEQPDMAEQRRRAEGVPAYLEACDVEALAPQLARDLWASLQRRLIDATGGRELTEVVFKPLACKRATFEQLVEHLGVAERLVASRTRAGSVVHELLLTGVALVGETLALEQGAPDYPETFGLAVGGSTVHGDQLNVYYELKLAFTERLKSADSLKLSAKYCHVNGGVQFPPCEDDKLDTPSLARTAAVALRQPAHVRAIGAQVLGASQTEDFGDMVDECKTHYAEYTQALLDAHNGERERPARPRRAQHRMAEVVRNEVVRVRDEQSMLLVDLATGEEEAE